MNRALVHAERKRSEAELIENLREQSGALGELLAECSSHWGYEDPIYRFYHQSYKVYFLQETTQEIVGSLKVLLPDRPLNEWFLAIIADGTGKSFEMEHNQRWLEETRPIMEAFFHAKYFLEMACRYAKEFETAPSTLPSGWASLLYLYDLR